MANEFCRPEELLIWAATFSHEFSERQPRILDQVWRAWDAFHRHEPCTDKVMAKLKEEADGYARNEAAQRADETAAAFRALHPIELKETA